ncbi:type IV pilin protein [Microbulbifer sp. YPW1]|uniref:type IV pilin protein n=1 Tax=Microbulbifer sp. YPW1 TaxID=2745199 RepID=UPI001598EC8C|nr:type IV pilin protein [Microbulbifer sp. YPW1]QKX17359.1 prepilin-type N-terminal cleavage/methylation domain-containing protein [Microbulbifer sp. YPW1]
MSRLERGFTLIELMIVVAIIGIISAIAYPSYMESVRKSNRADAKAALNDVSHRLQRCFTAYSDYTHASCAVGQTLDDGRSVSSGEGMYTVTGNLTATTFALTAAPVAGTTQAGDSKCGSFTLTQAGVKGASGSLGTDCW